MVAAVKIPIPQSGMVIDPATGRPSREWYIYLENLGTISGSLASLPQARVWIGDAANNPVAHIITGDMSLSSSGVATLQATANTDEIAQDAVGGILADSATVSLSYSDVTPSITAAVIPDSITTTELADEAVTYAKIQDVTDDRLLGRSAGSDGAPMEITVGSGLTLAAGVLDFAGGGGDVFGPASSGDGNLALFDGTTGKLLKDGGALADAGHWEPVSNMNPAAPELLFDAVTGDVLMGWVS